MFPAERIKHFGFAYVRAAGKNDHEWTLEGSFYFVDDLGVEQAVEKLEPIGKFFSQAGSCERGYRPQLVLKIF
ncbi:MAG: hypothetical protein OEN01_08975 [Candidatus Krumholzibacteria bacterium]|nr:hypothetical protein [Candidatus Krumholzibacteria bacterium]